MQLRYEEDFVESAVLLCASGHGPSVPRLQILRYRKERERLYAILDPDERDAAFFKLHLDWFCEWGLKATLAGILQEYAVLRQNLTRLVLRKSRGKSDEGSELYVNGSAERTGVLAMRVERFADPEAMAAFARHELLHLQDMVDPAFGYQPELSTAGEMPHPRRAALERYRLLWDVTIDGRLASAGKATLSSWEQRFAEFEAVFAFWPESRQREVFSSLWSKETPSHSKLAVLVRDPRGTRTTLAPSLGALCPLCGFSTFAWAGDADLQAAARAIHSEFPDWDPAQGACGRCARIYQVQAKLQSA